MEATIATRVFKLRERELEDLDPGMDPEQIQEAYAESYPELTNASITGPVVDDDNRLVYTFEVNVGKKG